MNVLHVRFYSADIVAVFPVRFTEWSNSDAAYRHYIVVCMLMNRLGKQCSFNLLTETQIITINEEQDNMISHFSSKISIVGNMKSEGIIV